MKLFNRKSFVENLRELPLEDLDLVSGSGNGTSETFPGNGNSGSSGSGSRGGSTSNGTQYSECGAGRNGGHVVCVPNKE